MLKIKDNVNLDLLCSRYKFKKVQQDKRINYIYMPVAEVYNNHGNVITVNNDCNLFNLDYYIGQDRLINFKFNVSASDDFNKTIDKLYDLISDDLIEKIK